MKRIQTTGLKKEPIMNKRNLLLAATMLLTISATAQTNFRHITYDEAVNAAKAENKLVFMDFYTDWCGPCKMMTNEVFPKKEVGDFMNEMSPSS